MTRTDGRLLLLGDWNWLVRDPLDVLRLVFFAGTVAFALAGRSTAVGLTAASVLLLVARIVNLPRRLDLGVILAMTFIAWGTALSLYGQYEFYDTIVHGVTPVFYAPVLYVCLSRLDVLVDPGATISARQHVGVFVSTLAIGMAVGAGYEVVEWLSDSLLGTAFVESADDTGRDLLADTLGSLVGASFLAVWSLSGWSSRRRPYRPVPPPDLRPWARRATTALSAGRGAVERRRASAGPAALAASGAGAVVFGAAVVAWPALTVESLVVLFGVYAVVSGLLELVIGLVQGRGMVAAPLVVDALVSVAAGIVVLTWPRISVAILFYVMAVTMVAGGLAGVSVASTLRVGVRERTMIGAAAVASVVLGVVVLAWPRHTVEALRWLVAAQAFVVGVVLLTAAVRVRVSEARDRNAASSAAPPSDAEHAAAPDVGRG